MIVQKSIVTTDFLKCIRKYLTELNFKYIRVVLKTKPSFKLLLILITVYLVRMNLVECLELFVTLIVIYPIQYFLNVFLCNGVV